MYTAAVSKSVVEALAKENVEMLLVEPLIPKGNAIRLFIPPLHSCGLYACCYCSEQ